VARTAVGREPISPELALVCPELRSRALEEEQEHEHDEIAELRRLFDRAEEREQAEIRATRPLAVQLVLYTAAQIGTGVVVGLAAVASAAAALLALTLVARSL
jgi:hypothetical protein